MKKPKIHILAAVTLTFLAFTTGLYLGRSHSAAPVTVSVPAAMQTLPPETTECIQPPTEETQGIGFPIDINLATKEEFMALSDIGEVLAQRIVDYREENGPFDHVEDLMNVEGIGKKRLEENLDRITTGG